MKKDEARALERAEVVHRGNCHCYSCMAAFYRWLRGEHVKDK